MSIFFDRLDKFRQQPETGIMLSFYPSTQGAEIELSRAVGTSSAASTGFLSIARIPASPEQGNVQYRDALPFNNVIYSYRARHVKPGWTASSWAPTVSGRPDSFGPAIVQPFLPFRTMPYTDANYAVQAQDDAGLVADPDVTQSDGVVARVIAKGRQTGTAQHGDAVTYAQTFQSVPMVLLNGGISYEPRSTQWSTAFTAGLPQYDDLVALNPTASGFTMRARLRQKGASAAQTDDFATNSLSTVGATANANLVPGGSVNDNYTVRYRVAFDLACPTPGKPPITGTVTVAVDTNDGGGGGFVERRTDNYLHTNSVAECSTSFVEEATVGITVSGLGSSDDIQIRIAAITGGATSVVVHGKTSTDATRGVSYNTAVDAYAEKTPDADDTITWDAMAVSQ